MKVPVEVTGAKCVSETNPLETRAGVVVTQQTQARLRPMGRDNPLF